MSIAPALPCNDGEICFDGTMSLREVGVRLAMEGHVPESGGSWYPARVAALLTAAANLGSEQTGSHAGPESSTV